jgi:3-deoxy-D-manno-octulosonic-acid transferase
MLLLYNIGLRFYLFLIVIAANFNKKAKQWLSGRRNAVYVKLDKSVWFHFASLGEFEQGRPVLEQCRLKRPDVKIVITFFSPSGFEIRKNTPLADYVYYLPLDTPENARAFITAINPAIAIFTKYEYWYHFFNELYKRKVPLFMISVILRPNQVFFKWYGTLHRKMLTLVSHFFVQDERSVQLLNQLKITAITLSGDTRFDRVWANARHPKDLPLIHRFKNNQPLFIAGSTWPGDEKLIANLPTLYPDWKFIIAPHEIKEEKINNLLNLLTQRSALRFSQIEDQTDLAASQILIIDNIGMLAALYQYAEIAYIGGGFGAGIHNTLEAAAFGLPVIFGPHYAKFKEAKDLIALETGFSIQNAEDLKTKTQVLTNNRLRLEISEKARAYVQQQAGATQEIMDYIQDDLNLIN